MSKTRVEWTYRDNSYGMECKPADVDDLLEGAPGVTRDEMLQHIIDEIDLDQTNKDACLHLGLSMLWLACNEEGFGHHALRRAKEGHVSICFSFERVNDTQWEVSVWCHPQRRKGVRELGVRITVHSKPENAVHH